MESTYPKLAGHRGLRGEILVEVKKSQPITAKELADCFGVTANAVRRHLKELEADGLVVFSRERRGAGAPVYAYRLSDDGDALFPSHYGQALSDILDLVVRTSGREGVKKMFAELFSERASKMRAELAELNVEERLEAIARFMSEQGFMAASKPNGDSISLAAHNCAMRAIAEEFPELCAAEADFLRDVLQTDVRRDKRIPDGCNACHYTIKKDAQVPNVNTGSSNRE